VREHYAHARIANITRLADSRVLVGGLRVEDPASQRARLHRAGVPTPQELRI